MRAQVLAPSLRDDRGSRGIVGPRRARHHTRAGPSPWLVAVGLMAAGCFVDSVELPRASHDGSTGDDGSFGSTAGDGATDTTALDTSTGGSEGSGEGGFTSDDDASDGSTSGAPEAGFCARLRPAAAFCADFDQPGALASWEAPSRQGGGSVEIDDADATSEPNSLVTTVPAANGLVVAMASRSMAEAGPEIELEVSTRYEPDCFLDATTSVRILGVLYPDLAQPGSFTHQILLFVGSATVTLREVQPGRAVDHVLPIAAGIDAGWVDVGLSVRPAEARVMLELDGRVVLDEPLAFAPSPPLPPPILNLGIWTNVGSPSACEGRYDDLVVRPAGRG